jgi:hypothetical protein
MEIEHHADDEAGNRADPEHPAPRRHDVQQLRGDDRPEREAHQCEAALLQALIETAALRPRGRGDGREARRAVRALHRSHDGPNPDEPDEALHQPREPGHQREQHDGRDQHLAMTDGVGEPARKDREHAPQYSEDAREPADVAFRQAEVHRHRRK